MVMTKAEVLRLEAGREPGGAQGCGSFVRVGGAAGFWSAVLFWKKFRKGGRRLRSKSPRPAHVWGSSGLDSTLPL